MADTPPRRCQLNRNTKLELMIRSAAEAVESGPANPRLTDAVVFLGHAYDAVADFVDGHCLEKIPPCTTPELFQPVPPRSTTKKDAAASMSSSRRRFFARPCDDPAPGWCVEEFEVGKRVRWAGTTYERIHVRRPAPGPNFPPMTREEARREARLMQAQHDKENPPNRVIVSKRRRTPCPVKRPTRSRPRARAR